MKQHFKILAASLVSLLIVFAVASTANAAGFFVGKEDGTATIPAGKTVDSTAFIAGSQVVIDGTVQGDLYCAGETVTIKGTIDGDVICGGSTVTIDGTVKGDVRAAGSTVMLGGDIAGSVLVAGSSVTTSDNFKVGRDFTGAAETMNLAGNFSRDVLAAATKFTLSGTVVRDISAYTDQFSLADNASVRGNVWYSSTNKSNVPDGVVQGNVVFEQSKRQDETSLDLSGLLLGMLMLIVLAVVGVLVMPRFVHTAASLAPRDVLLAFLIGFVAILLTPLVGVLLAVTMIGLLAGIVLMLVWLLAIISSGIFASYYVGTLVLQKRATNAVLVALAGSVVLAVLLLIPFINVLAFILMVCIGAGMQIMHIRHQFSKNPYTITA